MRAYERLLKYVKYATTSAEGAESTPSTPGQIELARALVGELRALGYETECSDKCYVYSRIPATPGHEAARCLGLIAHMDTAPDFCGEGVAPRVIENYDGGEVELGCGRVLSPEDFPELREMAGHTLITASGDTLLGADDKAGIAEIMTLLEQLAAEGAPHGPLAVCFTPDEEVGNGVLGFESGRFGADIAYTVDGGPVGELASENFNASSARVSLRGVSVHTGTAKGIMVNAALAAMEFNALLPPLETPRGAGGREGFYHLVSVHGTCESAELRYNLRDFDYAGLKAREATLERAAGLVNERYGEGTVSVSITPGYRNMREKLYPEHAWVVENARRAMRAAGVEPVEQPVRGGTDGALLSWQGLPCPNLGTGGYAFHGPNEHITAEGMDKCVEILRRLVELYA